MVDKQWFLMVHEIGKHRVLRVVILIMMVIIAFPRTILVLEMIPDIAVISLLLAGLAGAWYWSWRQTKLRSKASHQGQKQ